VNGGDLRTAMRTLSDRRLLGHASRWPACASQGLERRRVSRRLIVGRDRKRVRVML
jgi:hypothetical protein